ncbi:MAG TPA: type I polyketide synthase, partial [Streptosporangiaceae bacterium]
DWSGGTVRLLTEPVPWTANGHPRRAGISAFGMSGTNAHLILEQPPTHPTPATAVTQVASQPATAAVPVLAGGVTAWLVSGRGPAGLAGQAARLAEFVAARPGLDPVDMGWSLATTRSVLEHRAVVTGPGRDQLLSGLAALAAGDPAAGVVSGVVADDGPGKTVFVFPGQGSQWLGMGRELAAVSPVFAARLAECGRALAPFVDWSLEEVLAGADGAPGLEAASVVQPVLWAVMVSLAAVWQAAGVVPDAVVGHSQGEIAGACVAGILSLEDAAKVVALRSRALSVLAGHGGMLSVAEPATRVQDRIDPFGDRLSVAAVNSPAATVVAGEPQALEELAARCAAAGVRTRMIAVDYASHTAQVEAIRDEIAETLAGIAPRPAVIPMVSAMTGQPVDGPGLDAGYWYGSLRAPVQFTAALATLAEDGHRAFIEVSPHPVLTGAITETLEGTTRPRQRSAGPTFVTGTLRRDDGGAGRLLTSLAEAYVHGAGVDWATVLPAGQRVGLPTYAFQHQRYWPAARPVSDLSSAGLAVVGHPLLGAAVELAAEQGFMFTGRLSVAAQPWLADHAVAGLVLVPGTAFVELAIRAGNGAECGHVDELTLEAPLVLPPGGGAQVQVVVGGPGDEGARVVEVYARPDAPDWTGDWARHARGVLRPGPGRGDLEGAGELAVWPPAGAVPIDVTEFYAGLEKAGYGYGPSFRGLRAAWRRGEEVLAEVALPGPAAEAAGSFGLHPALLDAALHAATLLDGAGGTSAGDGSAGDQAAGGGVRLPFAWSGVRLGAAGASALRVRVQGVPGGGLSLVAADGAGVPVVSVGQLVTRPAPVGGLAAAVPERDLTDALFTEEWAPLTAAETGAEADDPAAGRRWVVLGPGEPGLAAELAAAGVVVGRFPDVAGLTAAVTAGEPVPDVVAAEVTGVRLDSDPASGRVPAGDDAGAGPGCGGAAGGGVTGLVAGGLGLVQEWLAADGLGGARLVVVTRGA